MTRTVRPYIFIRLEPWTKTAVYIDTVSFRKAISSLPARWLVRPGGLFPKTHGSSAAFVGPGSSGPQNFAGKGVVKLKVVRFRGANRAKTKKKLLSYYMEHVQPSGCTMKEFLRNCSLSHDGTQAVYREK